MPTEKSLTGKRNQARHVVATAILVLAETAALSGQTTLRDAAAAQGLHIGAAASADEYGPPDLLMNPSYAGALSTQYSELEPANAMKWDVTQPTQTTYNFQPGDELVTFAEANNMRVRGHNLCWYQQFPAWLAPYAASATPAEMSTLLQNHINAEVTHFKGAVFAWDVVNEAFNDPSGSAVPGLRDSIWYDQPGIGQTGTGYIEQAFQWAHAADPNALLFYNDYNIEGPGSKFTAVYNMVQDFVQRGVPINGVGFEMHITTSGYPSAAGLAQNMQQLAALGIQVHITEMDVRLPVGSNGLASAADLATQAQIYQSIMTVCLQQPNCTAFQMWGVSYGDSWIPSFFPGYGAALPLDFNYNPTPAFNALLAAMRTPVPALTASGVVNSASYQAGSVAPGEIVAIFGTGVGPDKPAAATLTNGLVSSTAASTQVLFGEYPAPILYAGSGQVNVVVPFEVTPGQDVNLTINNNGQSSPPVSIPVAQAVPGIFIIGGTGSPQQAAVLNQDLSVNGPGNPAAAGSVIVVYATGGGSLSAPVTDGELPTTLINVANTTLTVGGQPATIDFAGLAPGFAGVLQINATLPNGLAAGSAVPIVLSISGADSSSQSATIAIQLPQGR
jgi:endo-1,4-beta-xylanase